MHDYDEGVADDARDRRDIADEIEIELLIKRRIDGVVRCGNEEGIAIWGSADDRLGAEIGASAGPVFDDERLAEPLRQPLADHARNDVSRAARGRKFRRGSFILNLPSHHSITSSARASSVGGTSRPRVFAVVTLMTRSNLVGCSTGMSAGFVPRRILSAKSAVRL